MVARLTGLGRFRQWPRRPGEPVSQADADLVAVATAAALLEISEFRFFELASERWFGRPASDRLLEAAFDDYMFREVVPPWVRHLARQVLDLAERAELDRESFDLERPQITEAMRTRGILLAVALSVLLVLFCVLASGYQPY